MKIKNFKKIGIILGMFILTFGFTSCNNDDDDVIDTAKEKYTVEYVVNNNESSPIFNIIATYNDKNGNVKNEVITTFPWKKSFEVEAPFTAKFKGVYVVKTGTTIPETVTIAKDASFKVMQGETTSNTSEAKSTTTMTKAQFEKYIKTNEIDFDFSYEIKK